MLFHEGGAFRRDGAIPQRTCNCSKEVRLLRGDGICQRRWNLPEMVSLLTEDAISQLAEAGSIILLPVC